jgi:hypothetical protein
MYIALPWVRPHFIFVDSQTNIVISYAVLHPQLKLKYFQQHNWSNEWIRTAKDIVREEYGKYNKPSKVPPPLSVCVSCHASIKVTDSCYQAEKDPEFKDKYLSLPIEKVSNLIVWWWEHRYTYLRLFVMAFDFLSTLGMLVISLDISL